MKNQIFVAVCIWFGLLCTNELQAQTSVGLRLGSPTSISLKHYLSETMAAEVYLGTRGYSSYRWNNLSAAIQLHKPLDYLSDYGILTYYYGGGASVYFWRYGGVLDGLGYNSTSFGIQAYAGLDIMLHDLPLNLSIDWIPSVFIGSNFLSGFRGGYGTLSVRYLLGQ